MTASQPVVGPALTALNGGKPPQLDIDNDRILLWFGQDSPLYGWRLVRWFDAGCETEDWAEHYPQSQIDLYRFVEGIPPTSKVRALAAAPATVTLQATQNLGDDEALADILAGELSWIGAEAYRAAARYLRTWRQREELVATLRHELSLDIVPGDDVDHDEIIRVSIDKLLTLLA